MRVAGTRAWVATDQLAREALVVALLHRIVVRDTRANGHMDTGFANSA